jgi:hypothetical protein
MFILCVSHDLPLRISFNINFPWSFYQAELNYFAVLQGVEDREGGNVCILIVLHKTVWKVLILTTGKEGRPVQVKGGFGAKQPQAERGS